MNPFIASLSRRTAALRRLLPVLGFMLTATTLLPNSARAEAGAASAPPDFPDTTHVPEGCYISTAVYLTKFRAAFPGELAAPVSVRVKHYLGPHTVALVSWSGRWWLRDEFMGVIALDAAVNAGAVSETLRAKAEATLDRRTRLLSKRTRERLTDFGDRIVAARNETRDVATAAMLLPCDSERFWVRCGDREVPMLFFRPAAGVVAVYSPVHGTATAETTITSSRRVVELVARELGYNVSGLRSEPTLPGVVLANELAMAAAR